DTEPAMLEIVTVIAVVLAIAIAIILILAASKPNTFSVRRATTVKAPPEKIFGLINVGSGRMEILDASAPSKIVIKLDFFIPFEAHNTAEFTMLPQGDATLVTWLMHGPAPFMSKLMQVFINIDNMIGKDFETGLANLKRI